MSQDEYKQLKKEFSEIVQRSNHEIEAKYELIALWEEALWQGVESDPELVDSYERCQQFEWRTYKVYETSTDSGYRYSDSSGVSEYYISESSVFKGYAAAWFNGHNVLLDDYEMTRCFEDEEEVPKEPQTDRRPRTIDNIRDWYRKRWVASNTFSEIRDARDLVSQARQELYNSSLWERKLLPQELEDRRREDAEFSAQLTQRAAERAQAQAVLKERWQSGYGVTCAECYHFGEGLYAATYMLSSGAIVEGTLQVSREGRYLRDLVVIFRYEEDSFGSRRRQCYVRFETEGDAAPLRLDEEPESRRTLPQDEEGKAEASLASPVQVVPPKLRELLSGGNEYLDLASHELLAAQSLDDEIQILIRTDQELGLEGEMIRLVLLDLVDGRLKEIDDFRERIPAKNWKKGYTELKREASRLESLQSEMPSDKDKLIETIRSLVDVRASQL